MISHKGFVEIVTKCLADHADSLGRVNMDPKTIAETIALCFFPCEEHTSCQGAILYSDGECPACGKILVHSSISLNEAQKSIPGIFALFDETQKIECLNKLMENRCRECYGPDDPCYCWNDE